MAERSSRTTQRIDKPAGSVRAATPRGAIRCLKEELAIAKVQIAALRTLLCHGNGHAKSRQSSPTLVFGTSQPHAPLTAREREVLLSFLEYFHDEEVAGHLGTAVQTVRNQINSIRRKLFVRSREELVSFALTGRRAQNVRHS